MATVMPKWQSWVAVTRPCGQQSLEYLLSSPLLKEWPIPNLTHHSPGRLGLRAHWWWSHPRAQHSLGQIIVLSPADLPACHTVTATDSNQEWNWEGGCSVCGFQRWGPHQRPVDFVWMSGGIWEPTRPISWRVWGSQALCPLRAFAINCCFSKAA